MKKENWFQTTYQNFQKEQHVKTELKKLHKLAMQNDPAYLKGQAREREERRDAIISAAVGIPALAGITVAACAYLHAKDNQTNPVQEQPRIERVVENTDATCDREL